MKCAMSPAAIQEGGDIPVWPKFIYGVYSGFIPVYYRIFRPESEKGLNDFSGSFRKKWEKFPEKNLWFLWRPGTVLPSAILHTVCYQLAGGRPFARGWGPKVEISIFLWIPVAFHNFGEKIIFLIFLQTSKKLFCLDGCQKIFIKDYLGGIVCITLKPFVQL